MSAPHMIRGVLGRTDAELRERRKRGQQRGLLAAGALVGTPAQVADQLAEWAELGLDGVMLQWLDIDDFDRLEALAKAVL